MKSAMWHRIINSLTPAPMAVNPLTKVHSFYLVFITHAMLASICISCHHVFFCLSVDHKLMLSLTLFWFLMSLLLSFVHVTRVSILTSVKVNDFKTVKCMWMITAYDICKVFMDCSHCSYREIWCTVWSAAAVNHRGQTVFHVLWWQELQIWRTNKLVWRSAGHFWTLFSLVCEVICNLCFHFSYVISLVWFL